MSDRLDLKEHFRTAVSRDLADMFIGNYIGGGVSRDVYAHAHDPKLVIKIENSYGQFQNVYEDQIWEHIRETKFARWFAPVIRISGSGTVLFMRKTHPVSPHQLPTHLPSFFTDIKAENFGWLDGNIVCHDYGHHRFLEMGMTNRMRKANWSET